MKVCSKCGKKKELGEFHKGKSQCKECRKEYKKEYREKNKEEIKEQAKEYYQKNAEKIKEQAKEYREKNKEKRNKRQKEYREKNKEKIRKKEKEYYQKNKEKIKQTKKEYCEKNKEKLQEYHKEYRKNNKERKNEYFRERIKTDIQFKLRRNLRTRIWQVLKGHSKSAGSIELLGCSIEQFKKHLEFQFTDGMTWENYGEWHVDHIMPCSSFDLTCPKQQKQCFHYTNTQPLWAEENISKSNKIPERLKNE